MRERTWKPSNETTKTFINYAWKPYPEDSEYKNEG
jgi:hypothetical protein